MVKFSNISSILTETSNVVKALVATFALVAALSAFYVAGRAIVSLPSALAAHDSAAKAEWKSFDRILCITVADHRKLDWRLCFINPSEVMPKGDN